MITIAASGDPEAPVLTIQSEGPKGFSTNKGSMEGPAIMDEEKGLWIFASIRGSPCKISSRWPVPGSRCDRAR